MVLPRPASQPRDRAGSDLHHASIDGKLHAGNVRTFIGGKKHHGGCNFLRFTSATERNLRDELFGRLLGLFGSETRFLKCWSVDWSGAYRIHSDFAVFQLHGPATCETAHSRLARGIDGKRRQSHYVGHRSVKDDRTSIFEERNGLLHRKECSLGI